MLSIKRGRWLMGNKTRTPVFLCTSCCASASCCKSQFFYVFIILHEQGMKEVSAKTNSRVKITFFWAKGVFLGDYRDKSQKRLMHATAMPCPSSGSSKPGGFFHWNSKGFSYQKALVISRSSSLSRCHISSNLNATSVVIKTVLQRNKSKENILEVLWILLKDWISHYITLFPYG